MAGAGRCIGPVIAASERLQVAPATPKKIEAVAECCGRGANAPRYPWAPTAGPTAGPPGISRGPAHGMGLGAARPTYLAVFPGQAVTTQSTAANVYSIGEEDLPTSLSAGQNTLGASAPGLTTS